MNDEKRGAVHVSTCMCSCEGGRALQGPLSSSRELQVVMVTSADAFSFFLLEFCMRVSMGLCGPVCVQKGNVGATQVVEGQ